MMPKQVPNFKNRNNHLGEITDQIERKDWMEILCQKKGSVI